MTRYLLMGLLALALAGGAYAQFGDSVLPNGDFEEGLTGWNAGISDAKQLGVAVTADDGQAQHGAKSLKISLPGGPSGAGVACAPAPVEAGKQYLITFYFRSEGFSDNDLFAGVNLQYTLAWLDAEKKQVPGPSGSGLAYGAVKDWRFRCTLFTAPPRSASLAISFNMSCDEKGRASSAWFDRVQIRPYTAPPPDGKDRVFPIHEGAYDSSLFRRVADDDTPSGFAVIANPKFVTKPGYVAGGLYLRTLPPGLYRVVWRIKVGETPAEPKLLNWDLNTGLYGYLNAGAFSTADFAKAGVYQDCAAEAVLPPGAVYLDPRLHWSGGFVVSVDTVTFQEEKVFTPEDLKALME